MPEYTRLPFFPLRLQAEYAPPNLPIAGPITPRHLLGLLLVALLLVLFFRFRKRAPLIAFGIWWAGVAIGPVSSILNAAGIVMAERVFFQPSLGFAFALAGGPALFETVPRRRLELAVQGLLAIWVVGATIRSALRVPVWHDQDRFFTAMPIDGPRDYKASLVSGMYWLSTDRPDRAEHDWPHDAGTNETLGQLLRANGRCGEAVAVLRQGLEVEPDRIAVRAKLFQCLLQTGDTAEAVRVGRAGVAMGDSSFRQMIDRLPGASSRP